MPDLLSFFALKVKRYIKGLYKLEFIKFRRNDFSFQEKTIFISCKLQMRLFLYKNYPIFHLKNLVGM